MRAVEDFLTSHGTVAVMESRIVPLLPYGVVNFSAGLTTCAFARWPRNRGWRDPKVFAYTALGGTLTISALPRASLRSA